MPPDQNVKVRDWLDTYTSAINKRPYQKAYRIHYQNLTAVNFAWVLYSSGSVSKTYFVC